MQGINGSNGLPRPYYMKPASKRKGHSPYDNLKTSQNVFNTPRRKLLGYLVLLILFGSCVLWMSFDLRTVKETTYEIINNAPNLQKINSPQVGSIKIPNKDGTIDKESKIKDLAGNLAQGSKGEKGIGVSEAPKGGVANEAPIVGSDEEELIGIGKKHKSGTSSGAKGVEPPVKEKGYKAEKAETLETASKLKAGEKSKPLPNMIL